MFSKRKILLAFCWHLRQFNSPLFVFRCFPEKACILVWPDGYQGSSAYDYVYNLAFFLVTYLLPSLGMALCFSQMGHHLKKGQKSILQLVMVPQVSVYKSRKDKQRVGH